MFDLVVAAVLLPLGVWLAVTRPSRQDEGSAHPVRRIPVPALIVLVAAVGCVGGIYGIGGGSILAPILIGSGRRALHFPPDGKLRVYRSRTGGDEWEALTSGLPQQHCYVNVLRDAMAVDSLQECGVYFGTTGGQVYASADAGDNWAPIVCDLSAVLSVEAQTLP